MKRGRPRKGEGRVKLTKPDHRCYHGLRMWTVAGHDLDVLRLHRDEWGVVTSWWTIARDHSAAEYCRARLAWCNAEIARHIQIAVLPVRDA